ncbi:expressed unknown protein [Seminavis robusta]|uniref:Uncharacterized protein n=1 Tax=Seminavis robusta TaxID=568900 RepID=A0A9N8HRI2_9STRA|nr:expressed unknown protein [Seminavis robusta]|eukprot:Sro1077_g238590.1 n/a (153) ;mRNA; f:15685-16143
MGNVDSSTNNLKSNGSSGRKGGAQRRGSLPARLPSNPKLEENDLSEILHFVQHMKQTNLGGNMLEEFVVKQASAIDDELNDCASMSSKLDEKHFPIKTIVLDTSEKSMKDFSMKDRSMNRSMNRSIRSMRDRSMQDKSSRRRTRNSTATPSA